MLVTYIFISIYLGAPNSINLYNFVTIYKQKSAC